MRFILSSSLLIFFLLASSEAAAARGILPEKRAEDAARLVRAHKLDAAIAEYERAITDGAGHFAIFELAQAHQLAGHVDQALTNYKQFLRLAPRSPLRFEVRAQVIKLARRAALRRASAAPGTEPAAGTSVSTAASGEWSPDCSSGALPLEGMNEVDPETAAKNRAASSALIATPVPTPALAATSENTDSTSAPTAVASLDRVPPAAPSPRAESSEEMSATPPVRSPARVSVMMPLAPATVAAPVSNDPLLRPLSVDVGQFTGAALTIVGAVALGTAFGLGMGSLQLNRYANDPVLPDPEAEAGSQRYASAATAVALLGVAAAIAGGAVFVYHNEHTRPKDASDTSADNHGDHVAPSHAPRGLTACANGGSIGVCF